MLKHAVLVVVFVLFTVSFAPCEERSAIQIPKFGKVTDEHSTFAAVEGDPDADIAVLFDVMDMRINEQFELEMSFQHRKKILAESGIDKVDIRIPYYKSEKIYSLKAHTILPDGKKIKVKKKDIFEEKSGNWRFKVFTFPAVETGAIVEYTYKKFSEYITYLEPWSFQSDEFTRLSKVSITIPPGFKYKSFLTSISASDFQPIKEYVLGTGNQRNAKFTWQLQDVPALRDEPYVANIDDYCAALYFQLESFKNAFIDVTFIKSRNDLAEQVHEMYKPYLSQNKNLDQVAIEHIAGAKDDYEKIQLLYEFVRDSIETAGSTYFLSDELEKPADVLAKQQGTAAEKNLLMLNFLRHAGFEAFPFLISTRSNGLFRPNWPQLSQFNHVLAHVFLGGGDVFMDASDDFVPFGMLPANDIVTGGLLVQGKIGRLIEMQPPKTVNMVHAKTKARLSDDGALHCKSFIRYEDYAGIVKRANLAGKEQEDYVREWLEEKFDQVTLDSFSVKHLEIAEMPLTVELEYDIKNYSQIVGDMLYFSPCLLLGMDENPFKRETRNFPVDYTYILSASEDVSITLPDNYAIVESPPPLSTQDDIMRFSCVCKHDSLNLQFQRLFMLNHTTYRPRDYQKLRQHYEKVVSADQGQVVLKQVLIEE